MVGGLGGGSTVYRFLTASMERTGVMVSRCSTWVGYLLSTIYQKQIRNAVVFATAGTRRSHSAYCSFLFVKQQLNPLGAELVVVEVVTFLTVLTFVGGLGLIEFG